MYICTNRITNVYMFKQNNICIYVQTKYQMYICTNKIINVYMCK